VPYALVVQDLVGQGAGQSGIAGGAAVANIVGRVEARAFREAAIVAVVTDSFREQLKAYGVDESKIRLLPNWSHIAPATSDRATFRRRLGWDESAFVVLHTGNMGLKQDLGNVIEAARELGARSDIRIVLCGDGSQRPTLMKQAKGLGNLEFLDTVSDDDYADLLHAADLLLVNERSSVGDMALPSKLTSYFAAGRAVLAAVGSDGACAREIEKTQGAARLVEPGNPAALAKAIEELALDGEATAAMAAAGARYAEDHLSRAAAERRAHTLVEELLAYHRDAPAPGSA
jgi:glycosyltransferase involved in cell wall biosynthesis